MPPQAPQALEMMIAISVILDKVSEKIISQMNH